VSARDEVAGGLLEGVPSPQVRLLEQQPDLSGDLTDLKGGW
jgi:hypothetical protein